MIQWLLLAQAGQQEDDFRSWLTAGLLVTLLVVYAADKLLAHLKTRGIDLKMMSEQLKQLHEWHDHDDPEQPGLKIWWNQKALAEMIKQSANTQRELVTLLSNMREEQKRQHRVQEQQIILLSEMIKSQELLQRKLEAMEK